MFQASRWQPSNLALWTREAVWRFPLPAGSGPDALGVASSPAVGDGLVFFGALDGTFYAFKI